MNEEELRTAIRLSGQLAIYSRMLLNANLGNLTERASKLEAALDEYDNYILSFTKWQSINSNNS